MDPDYLKGYYLKAFPLVQLKQYSDAVENFEIFKKNAGPEYKKELEFTEENLKNLHKFLGNEIDEYKRMFPLNENSDFTNSNLKIEGRLKGYIIKIFGQKEGLRVSEIDITGKVKENLFFIKYNQINNIKFEKGSLGGDIKLNALNTEIKIQGIPDEEGSLFIGRTQERINQHNPNLKTKKVQKIEGYDKNTGYEIEILILDEGISLNNKKDDSKGSQILKYEDIRKVKFQEGWKKGILENQTL